LKSELGIAQVTGKLPSLLMRIQAAIQVLIIIIIIIINNNYNKNNKFLK